MQSKNKQKTTPELLRLINYDLHRFFHSLSFRVCLIIGILIILFSCVLTFLIYMFYDDLETLTKLVVTAEIDSEATLEKPLFTELLTAFSASGIPFLMSTIVVTNFISSEFSSFTMRNLIAKGFSRTNIYISKVISSFIGTIIISFSIGIISTVCNTALFGFDETGFELGRTIQFFTMNYVSFFTYCSIFTTVGMLIKSGTAVMTINILLVTFSSLLVAIIDIPLNAVGISASKYWVVSFTGSMLNYSFADELYLTCIIGTGIYAIVFFIIGLFGFKKSDIK